MANTIDFNVSTNAVNVLNQTGAAAENTAKGFTSAKAELRALQQQLLQMDQTSEEFKKASARAAELKDNISDLSAEISANAGNAFEGLSNNVSLFGSRLMDLDLKGAGQALTGMGAAVRRIDFKTVKEEVGGLIKGLADLGKAILANPILLFAAAIAGVIANWKEFAALFKGETAVLSSLKKELGTLEAQNAAIKNKITYAKVYGDSLYQQYVLSQQLLENEIKQEQTKKRIAEIQDDSEASEEARKKIIELQNKALLEQTQHIVDYYNTISDANLIGNDAAKIEDEKRKATEKYNTALEETRAKLIQLRSDRSLSLSGVGNAFDIQVYEDNERKLLDAIDKTNKTIDKREADARKEIAQKELEANAVKAAAEIKQEQDLAAQKLKVRQDYIRANQSAQANELYELELKKEQELQTWEGAEEDKVFIVEKYRLLELDINKKYDDLALQQQIEADEKRKAADEKAKADELAREKQLAADKLAAEQALAEAKWNIANGSIALLGTLFQKNKKAADIAFALEKGLAIAKVVVSNRAANAEILAKQLAFYSSSGPLALPLAAASAAPMFAANNLNAAASIAAIVASGVSKYMGGGGASLSTPSVGGGGGGTQAPSPANFAFLGMQPQQQPPLQAYVVSGQVSSNLEAQQLINNQARLGG